MLKLLRISLVVAIVCVAFVSCDKDDEPQYELFTGEKKITKVEIQTPSSDQTLHFFYDSRGRLSEVILMDDYGENVYDYVWTNNRVSSFTLKNGIVSKCDGVDIRYSTISEGKLSEVKPHGSYTYDHSFVWDSQTGGLLRRGVYYRQENRSTLEHSFHFGYGDIVQTCAGYNPIFAILISQALDDYLFLAHPELVNARINAIPQSFINEECWIGDSGRFESEMQRGKCICGFDNDGYLVKCVMNEESSDYYAYRSQYSFTWE